jgi:hypothetical protein
MGHFTVMGDDIVEVVGRAEAHFDRLHAS